MKLKEHKIAIILGIIGLLIPIITYFFDTWFYIILMFLHPFIFTLSYVILDSVVHLFNLPLLENLELTLQACIFFLLYYSAIGHFIDKAIKNKVKRKKILVILVTTVITLNAIGFWFIILSPFGIRFS